MDINLNYLIQWVNKKLNIQSIKIITKNNFIIPNFLFF